jgi:3-polyprenyl-4-hydroxybenzoate decarboxylase
MTIALYYSDPNLSNEVIPPASAAPGYRDFRRHLDELHAAGLLVRVDRPIDKDTELHPLVRWQYCRGIPEPRRRAFLFSDVRDGAGHEYDIRVAVGALAGNRAIYATSVGHDLAAVNDAWRRATETPRQPVEVSSGPCQEIVREGPSCWSCSATSTVFRTKYVALNV